MSSGIFLTSTIMPGFAKPDCIWTSRQFRLARIRAAPFGAALQMARTRASSSVAGAKVLNIRHVGVRCRFPAIVADPRALFCLTRFAMRACGKKLQAESVRTALRVNFLANFRFAGGFRLVRRANQA